MDEGAKTSMMTRRREDMQRQTLEGLNGLQIPPINRPSLATQQSSSLPSTPYVHARKLSDEYQTPSPTIKGAEVNSPRSARSESDSTMRPPGRTPFLAGCKYETGMTYSRRRMPYSIGADKLEFSLAKVKKHLDPADEEKLSGDMRELYDRILPSADSDDRRARFVKKLETILNDRWPGNNVKVNVFGSSGNLLCTNESDVDICITTPMKALERVCLLAKALAEHGMERVVCVPHAKVPIVKMWDPELKLACDMNVNNTLALENTRMIRTYVQIDPRVRPLAMIIKHWAKQRILNDAALGGTLSSYTWICLIINFLQTRSPSVLPNLQARQCQPRPDGQDRLSPFADDLKSFQGHGKANHETLGQLLFGFFRCYGYEMDFEKHVVSVRSGGLISKQGKKWHLMANNRLCVEEPFNTDRNLGNTADDTSFRGIHLELRRAFTLLSQANLDECCEQYIFPPQEEKVWVKPPPQPRPVITRSQSQSGRSGKGGGSGGNNRNGNSGSKQRNGQSNRRASSSAAPVKMAYPGAHQNLQQQIPNIAGRDGMSGNQIHDRLFQHYQYLQAQEQQLRLHMQQRAQANIHAQITSQLPVALYPTGPDGQQHTPLNLKPFPTPGSQPSQPGSPAAMSLAPHFYYPPGTILVHQPIGRNITNMPNPQQSSTNPPSPSLASAQPNVTEFRRSGLRAPSTTESSAAQSIRSRSQPPRTRVNRPPAQYASGSPALQGPQLGFRTLQEYQKAYLQSKGPDRQMVPIDLNSLHLNPAMTDPDTGYMGYFVDEATAHGTLFPPMQPRDSMKDPINRARGVSPSLSRLRAQTSRSPSPSYSNNSNRDRSISFYTAQSALSPPYTFGNVMNGNQVPNSGPVIVDGSSDTSGYVTPPESLFFQPPASDAASLSEDYPLNTPETTTTDTPLQDAIESLSLDIGEQRLTNSMPNVLQFGELPAVATSRNGITKMEEVAKPLGNKRAISPSETSTSGEPSNALGIDFTPPIRKIPSPPAIPNMSYSQAPAQAAVPSKSLASVLKPSLPQLSPVREVRTPSPTATRTNSGALETLNSSLASKTGHNRSISLSGKDMVSSPLSESTRADDKTKAKALTQPGPLANGFVNGVVTHNVEPQQQQPTPPLQTSGWQQSTGRKKKSRKGASVGSAPLIANPSNGERKGG